MQRWRQRLSLAAVIVAAVVLLAAAGRELATLKDRFTLARTVPVRSPVDGMTYAVHDAYPDAAAAADMLARINRRVVALLRHLKRAYVRPDRGGAPALARRYPGRARAVRRLLSRYNPDNVAENSPFDPEGDSAYSLDKGSLIALCLRDRPPRKGQKPTRSKGDGALHSIDTITFVMIHEMAHVAIDEVDHPPAFWATFKFLLLEAERAGLARFPDYRAEPVDYCGVKVDYSPAFDPAQTTLQ